MYISVELSCKLFDMLIRPIIIYNSEIWYMDEYLSIFKALNRSREHGTLCDILTLVDRSSFEKIHIKFCKLVLGIRKTSCNIAAKSELGRIPLDAFIKTQILMYFSRINSKNINPLIKEAFSLNKTLAGEGIYTWYPCANSIFQELKLDPETFIDFDKPFSLLKNSRKQVFKNSNRLL